MWVKKITCLSIVLNLKHELTQKYLCTSYTGSNIPLSAFAYFNEVFVNYQLVQGKCSHLVTTEHIHSNHLFNGSHALCNSTLHSIKEFHDHSNNTNFGISKA